MRVTRHIELYATPFEVAEHCAEHFVTAAKAAIDARGRFSVAFAGGATPRLLYEHLAERYQNEIEWEKVFAFWGDERCVPLDHPDSNYRMVRETLLDHVVIPTFHIFPMMTSDDPQRSAVNYEGTLREFFGDAPSTTFDLLLLGMGDDGHTASLFPHTSALQAQQEWVVAHFVDKAKGWRLTLTAPFLNLARQTLVLVTGKTKAERLKEVLSGEYDPNRLPIQRIIPIQGDITWAVDRAAGSALH